MNVEPTPNTPLDPEDVLWSKRMFDSMADGGIWGYPNAGLIFTRRGDQLVLSAAMPYMDGMEHYGIKPEELIALQAQAFIDVRKNFGAAGIEVLDATEEDTDARP